MRKMIQGVAVELKEIPIKNSGISIFTVKDNTETSLQQESRTSEVDEPYKEMDSFGGD